MLDVEREWAIGRQNPQRWWDVVVYPRGRGLFLRRGRSNSGDTKELVVGRWGLIPSYAKEPDGKWPHNARAEDLDFEADCRQAWQRAQRCIIPATDFNELNWATGRNVWWRFCRKDGRPWGLAGLWNAWIDTASGEVHESYTMLTINADSHPLMTRMQGPDAQRAATKQDKRSVVPLDPNDYSLWLAGTVDEARSLLQTPNMEMIDAAPA